MKLIDGRALLNELDNLLQDHEDEAYTPEDIRTTIMLMMLRAPAVSNAPTVHAHWAVVPSLFNKIDLKRAKVKAIDDSKYLEKVYNDAIDAFKKYRGDDE